MKIISSLLLIAILGFVSSAAAEGVFMVVKGDVRVLSKSKGVAAAKVGMKVHSTDKIKAGPESRAKVVMRDKNILNISPETEVVIEKYKFDESKDEKNVSLNVIYGKVRATVNQKYDGDKNKFQVKTPSAVAGVRGTDFLTSYNPTTQASKIVTFEGTVLVGSGLDPSGAIKNPVPVPAGTFSVASTNGTPSAPVPVPPQELQAMNSDSTSEPQNPNERSPAEQSGKKGRQQNPQETKNPGAAPKETRSPTNAPTPAPKAPSMISDMGNEIKESTPPPLLVPELPPTLVEVYKPPEVSTDIIQQNTNLNININVQ